MEDEGSKDYWTRSKIAKLVELYKFQDCLWNVSNPSYRDKRKRISAWKTIATGMNLDVMSVERKMKVLKTQFMHCYKLYKKYSLNGESYQPKWFAYNSLKFLIPGKIFRENREISRMQENGLQIVKTEAMEVSQNDFYDSSYTVNDNEEEHVPADIPLHNASISCRPLSQPTPSSFNNGTPRRISHNNEEQNAVPLSYEGKRDELAIFGELIACRLRKIQDPRARLTLQFNITNLVFDAEMQEIDRINGTSNRH